VEAGESYLQLFGSSSKARMVLRCQALSKRSQKQCRGPACRGKAKCKFHGGRSTGAKTEEGRRRCAEARTVHGQETRAVRSRRRENMARIRKLMDLAYALGIAHRH
jgi:hypothetical protein